MGEWRKTRRLSCRHKWAVNVKASFQTLEKPIREDHFCSFSLTRRLSQPFSSISAQRYGPHGSLKRPNTGTNHLLIGSRGTAEGKKNVRAQGGHQLDTDGRLENPTRGLRVPLALKRDVPAEM